jgi:hypothetical protein
MDDENHKNLFNIWDFIIAMAVILAIMNEVTRTTYMSWRTSCRRWAIPKRCVGRAKPFPLPYLRAPVEEAPCHLPRFAPGNGPALRKKRTIGKLNHEARETDHRTPRP